MKKILLTPRLVESESYAEKRDAIDVRWAALLSELSLLPIVLPVSSDPAVYLNEIEIGGVLLTGGNSLSTLESNALSEIRDNQEKRLLELAFKRGLPVLGVCRGAQFLSQYFGASFERKEGHVAVRHALELSASCAASLGEAEEAASGRVVNSYHDFVITEVCEDLEVLARAEDGTVEAFRHSRLPALGVMWHPEREEPFAKNDLRLLARFFSGEAK